MNYNKEMKRIEKRQTQARQKEEASAESCQGKLCPFMSGANSKIACCELCAFYRTGKKKGYECLFMEIGPLSYNMRRG